MDWIGGVDEYVPNFFMCECGSFCEYQSCDTSDVRRCHRGTGEESILIINLCAEDHVAGGTDINGGTEIGLIKPLLMLLGGCHSDDFPVSSGKDGSGFLRISSSGYQNGTLCISVINCILNNERTALASPTHVNDACPVVGCIDNC